MRSLSRSGQFFGVKCCPEGKRDRCQRMHAGNSKNLRIGVFFPLMRNRQGYTEGYCAVAIMRLGQNLDSGMYILPGPKVHSCIAQAPPG